ncbi:meso-2,3-butanediol dehydrogenase [Nocardioides korecus]
MVTETTENSSTAGPGATANSYAFTGRTVLVTGGGTGIGRAIAEAFLANGANVAVSGRRRAKLAEALAGHPADRVLAVEADVSDDDSAAAMVRAVVDRFGALDVVVNNAAAYTSGDFDELDLDGWRAIRSANVDGFVHVARHALPELERSGGNLVVVGSVSGLRGDWGQAAYNATKAAIMNFVQSLALDYGPRGVRLNAVAPALTITDLTRAVEEDEDALAKSVDRIALGRPGRPADIAPAVLFLASDDAAYITGAFLAVDGGTTASTGQAH